MKQNNDIANWVATCLPVIKMLHEKGHNSLIKRNFTVPGDPESYIEAIYHLLENAKENSIDLVEYFQTKHEPQVIIKKLVKLCEEGMFTTQHYKTIKVISEKIGPNWPWHLLVKPLSSKLQIVAKTNNEQISGYLLTIHHLSRLTEEAYEELKKLGEEGHLFYNLKVIRSLPEEKKKIREFSTAVCILAILEVNPKGACKRTEDAVKKGKNKYEKILKSPLKKEDKKSGYPDSTKNFINLIVKYNRINILFEAIEDEGITLDYENLLKKVILLSDTSKHNIYDIIPPDVFVEKFKIIEWVLEDNDLSEKYVNKYVESTDLVDQIISRNFDIELVELYSFIIDCKGKERKFTNFLIKGLQNVDKQLWIDELKKEGSLIKLVLKLIQADKKIGANNNLAEALFDHAKEVQEGKVQIKNLKKDLPLLVKALTQDSREFFIRSLRDVIIENSDSAEAILDVYGDTILNCAVLQERNEELVRRAFSSFIDRDNKNKVEIEWIKKVLTKCPGIRNSRSEASLRTFKQKVNRIDKDKIDDDIKPIIERIEDMLNHYYKERDNE